MHHWRDRTHHAQRLLVVAPTRYGWTADRSSATAAYREWARRLWHARYRHWHGRLEPWGQTWLSDAMCVHHNEGAWNDPNAPYWGGLQMDARFMAEYGARFLAKWGTADHWPPVSQLHAAYQAWRVRGWEPWPTTAAACGLL